MNHQSNKFDHDHETDVDEESAIEDQMVADAISREEDRAIESAIEDQMIADAVSREDDR